MKEVYFKTSDGNVFYTENAAQNHAKSLTDRSIGSVKVGSEIEPTQVKATETSSEQDYSKLTKVELLVIAQNVGVELPAKATKVQIIEQINHSKSK